MAATASAISKQMTPGNQPKRQLAISSLFAAFGVFP